MAWQRAKLVKTRALILIDSVDLNFDFSFIILSITLFNEWIEKLVGKESETLQTFVAAEISSRLAVY